MPYADPDRQRESQRGAMKRLRADRRREREEAEAAAAPKPFRGTLANWARKRLIIPPGHPLEGQPFRLMRWQVRFIRDALDPATFEALLCIARKNAKSATVAVIVLGHLVGPVHMRKPGWRAGVLSLNRDKANELLDQVEAIAKASGLLGGPHGITVRRVPRSIIGPDGRVEVQAAEKGAGHAAGYDLSIVDEIGLLVESQRGLVNGMRSAVSAKNGRFMSLSIHGDGPFVPEILARKGERGLVIQHYTARKGCRVDDPRAWKAANPGLGSIKTRGYMAREARRVKSTPADISDFRAYDLNQPQAPADEYLVDAEDWEACMKVRQPPRGGDLFVGLDLGETVSMTSAACYWPETGRMEVYCALPARPKLAARAQADKAGGVYQRAKQAGELWLFAGRRVPLVDFLLKLRAKLDGYAIRRMGCDRYRDNELLAALDDEEFDDWDRGSMEWRGTGASDKGHGSHDVRAFQRAVVSKTPRPNTGPNELLTWALGNAVLRRDGNGNPALDKRKQKHRIDAAQAGVIAVGLATDRREPRSIEYHGAARAG